MQGAYSWDELKRVNSCRCGLTCPNPNRLAILRWVPCSKEIARISASKVWMRRKGQWSGQVVSEVFGLCFLEQHSMCELCTLPWKSKQTASTDLVGKCSQISLISIGVVLCQPRNHGQMAPRLCREPSSFPCVVGVWPPTAYGIVVLYGHPSTPNTMNCQKKMLARRSLKSKR